MQHVERCCEVCPGKGPLPQHFLRLLVYFHDYDARIRGCPAGRPGTKARVQGVVFEALKEGKNWSRFFAEKSEVVKSKGAESDENADEKRHTMAPPGLEKFVEAESAPPLPETH